jgi:hypothetical protein
VRRETSVPIGIWLPALVAGVALAFGWRSTAPTRDRAEPPMAARELGEAPHAPPPSERREPDAPPSEAPDPAPDEPRRPETSEVASPADPPAVPPAPAPSQPDSQREPARWTRLAEVTASDFGDSPCSEEALRWLAALRAQLGPSAGDVLCSAASLLPWVVVRDAGCEELARSLAAFHARLTSWVLEPAGLADPVLDWIPVALGLPVLSEDPALRERPPVRIDATAPARDAARTAGRAWIEARFERRGLAGPPRWWRDGAIELASHPTLSAALASAPSGLSLRELFDAGVERDDLAPLAGGFAAFCLGASGVDEHRKAAWLELSRPATGAPGPPRSREAEADEIAARFGFTRLEELEASFAAARRR